MYIDTSALVAYYLPEDKSDLVQQKIAEEKRVQISQLTETEMLSAFNKKKRMKEINRQKSAEAYQLFQSQIQENAFQVFNLTHAVFKSSIFILKTTMNPLRTLDALHLGVTYEYGLKLFSFDEMLLKTAKEFNIETFEREL